MFSTDKIQISKREDLFAKIVYKGGKKEKSVKFSLKECYSHKGIEKKEGKYSIGVLLRDSPKLAKALEGINTRCMELTETSEDLLKLYGHFKTLYVNLTTEQVKGEKVTGPCLFTGSVAFPRITFGNEKYKSTLKAFAFARGFGGI